MAIYSAITTLAGVLIRCFNSQIATRSIVKSAFDNRFTLQPKLIHLSFNLLGKYKFLDWDDLEPLDIIKLKNLHYLDNNSTN